MKRVFIVFGIIGVLFLTACTKSEIDSSDKMIHEHCIRNGVMDNGEASLNYDIYYTGEVMNRLEATEKVTSEDNSLLDEYENAYREIHNHYVGLDYYITEVIRRDNYVMSKTVIDYDHINIEKLIDIEGTEDNIFDGNVPKIAKWKDLAKKFGAQCKVVE